jgi:uncharacterized membrane protein
MTINKKRSISAQSNYVNLERLTFLIDGVFAITMTLLVLELRPPETLSSQLAKGLLAMLPRLLVYLIAFYTIANYWIIHQRTFRHITDVDTLMVWLMLFSLLFITLIPASTAIIGRYPGEGLAVACFSVNSALLAFTSWVFWVYVRKNQKQFASSSDPRLLAIAAQVWMIITLGWFTSIIFSFLNIYLAFATWVLWPNLVAIWGNRKRHQFL